MPAHHRRLPTLDIYITDIADVDIMLPYAYAKRLCLMF